MPMSRRQLSPFALALLSAAAGGQDPLPPLSPPDETQRKLPDGRLQVNAIVEANHKRALGDTKRLRTLIEEFATELEKDTRWVLSVAQLKRLEEIERVAKRLQGRLKQ